MFKKFLKKQGTEFIAPVDDVVGMCIYKDKLLVATKKCVYQLNKRNKLIPIEFEEKIKNDAAN